MNQLDEDTVFLYKDENKFATMLWKFKKIQRVVKST